jgi:hypoxanthine phosphoribosyltransferase
MNTGVQPKTCSSEIPFRWRDELCQILISQEELAGRVKELSHVIERDYQGKELVIVSLLSGTVMFLADLIRHISLPMRLDFIGVSSYRSRTKSGAVVFTKELGLNIAGKDVLLVDDILDTGKTLARVQERLHRLKPKSIRKCVLLNKIARRTEDVSAEYVGFDVPDAFVVGYGLDFAEQYRNLPFIGVLKPEIYQRISSGK